MIRLTIRLLVYALVMAITITLSPGIMILPLVPGVVDISATYLLFGILFGLIFFSAVLYSSSAEMSNRATPCSTALRPTATASR